MPSIDGVEHRFAEVRTADGPLRVHLAEAGDGEPLLLLHGWPQHWYCWRRVVPALAGPYRLLMPDLRGFGWTDAPGRGYDTPTFAADAIALLDALGLDRVRLVGHDWGGFTAFLLGLGHPERFERIVAMSAPHPWARPSPRTLAQLWRTWYVLLNATPRVGPAVLARRRYIPWFLRLGGRDHLWSDDEAAAFAERLAPPERAHATAALDRHYLTLTRALLVRGAYEVQRLRVPTRLLFGTDDFFIPAGGVTGGEGHGDDFAIELVDGCGHFMPEERPELVAERVLAFMG